MPLLRGFWGKNFGPMRTTVSKWLTEERSRLIRLGVLTATVVSYPIGTLLINGPFLRWTFPWLYEESQGLPEHVRKIIDEEYSRFLQSEQRLQQDTVASFRCALKNEPLDTLVKGSLGVRTGAKFLLPFYVSFQTVEDAVEYCKKNFTSFKFFGTTLLIDWNSEFGRAIAETLVLSEKALRFVVLRDLNAYKDYRAFVTQAVTWTGFLFFGGVISYWLHSISRYQHSLLFFLFVVFIVDIIAYAGYRQWYQLYRHVADIEADRHAAMASAEHADGGKEYYWKMLKRNRLLRELAPAEISKVKLSGDVKGVTSSIIKRYHLLKTRSSEDDELKDTMELDD